MLKLNGITHTDEFIVFHFDPKEEIILKLDEILNFFEHYELIGKNHTFFDVGCFTYEYEYDDKVIPIVLNFTHSGVSVIIVKKEGYEKVKNDILREFEFKIKK